MKRKTSKLSNDACDGSDRTILITHEEAQFRFLTCPECGRPNLRAEEIQEDGGGLDPELGLVDRPTAKVPPHRARVVVNPTKRTKIVHRPPTEA